MYKVLYKSRSQEVDQKYTFRGRTLGNNFDYKLNIYANKGFKFLFQTDNQ